MMGRQAILPSAGATDASVAVAAPRPEPVPPARTPGPPAPPPAQPAPKAKATVAEAPPVRAPEPPAPAVEPVTATPAAASAPAAAPGPASGLFRIQVGAFRDPQNADRLAEQLRREGADVLVTGSGGENGSLYRIVARPAEGESADRVVERLRGLGHRVEETPGGVVVGQPVAVRAAIETTRQLREQGVRVKLERVPAPVAGLRNVRVGGYTTAEEAERARGELIARGYPAVVVRER
jgi:cell division protein FtsN